MAAYALAGEAPVAEEVVLVQAPGPGEKDTWNALGKAQHEVNIIILPSLDTEKHFKLFHAVPCDSFKTLVMN